MRMKHVRDFSLRYDILRGKIKYAEAEAVGAAAVSMDARRKIKQVFTGDLILPEQMERLTDRLRPVLILDGTEYPLGQFILTTAKQVREGGRCFCRCEGYDLCFLAQRTRLEERLFLQSGERYTDWIQALLQQCGILSAIVEDSDETFSTDREDWEIGTPVLDVINSLLDEISYRSLWFDAQGNALQVVSNSYTFDAVGSYKLVYTLTLSSGTYTREMQITVEEGSDTPGPGVDSSTDSGSGTGSEGTASGGCNGCGGTLSMAFFGLPALAAAAVLIVRKKHTDD